MSHAHLAAPRAGSTWSPRHGLAAALGLTSAIMIAEAAGGWWANSLALASDAAHMLTDALALSMSLFAVTVACRPATSRKTYGWHRVEILAALINGVVLALLSLWILYEASRRMRDPQPVAGALMVAVSAVGLAANLIGLRILSRSGRGVNIRSARLHVMSDALSSSAVLGGAALIAATSWYRIDPILSVLIAGFIMLGAFRLVRETVDILLEGTPIGIDPGDVCQAIEAVRGIRGVHDLHIWSITSGKSALSGHVILDTVALGRSDEVLNRIKEMLERRFGIDHTTIQIESESYSEVGEVH